MLVTFHSPATPDVVMLRDLAAYLLGAVGKRLDMRGVIRHEELATAIDRLDAALKDDAKTFEQHAGMHRTHADSAGLGSRALPFMDMLRLADQHHADIVWSA